MLLYLYKEKSANYLFVNHYFGQKLSGLYNFKNIKENKINSAYYSDLPSTEDEYFINLNKKVRADTRRQCNRLMSKGTLEFDVFDKISDNDFSEFINQKRQRYHDTGVFDYLISLWSRKGQDALLLVDKITKRFGAKNPSNFTI